MQESYEQPTNISPDRVRGTEVVSWQCRPRKSLPPCPESSSVSQRMKGRYFHPKYHAALSIFHCSGPPCRGIKQAKLSSATGLRRVLSHKRGQKVWVLLVCTANRFPPRKTQQRGSPAQDTRLVELMTSRCSHWPSHQEVFSKRLSPRARFRSLSIRGRTHSTNSRPERARVSGHSRAGSPRECMGKRASELCHGVETTQDESRRSPSRCACARASYTVPRVKKERLRSRSPAIISGPQRLGMKS